MKKINTIITILIVITIILEIINVHISNVVTSNSIYVSKLEGEINRLDHNNEVIKSEILSHTSFETIKSKAFLLGFVENKEYITLTSPLGLALNR